jgi:catechol 2,3-dioxygenase-like lactoylglutathione lyase family enzyme
MSPTRRVVVRERAAPCRVPIAADELPAWETRVGDFGIAIEGRTNWPRGGISIYFRDPDGHLLELATPGLWPGH